MVPFQRRSKLPDLPLEIWLEIFQFATHVYPATTITPPDPFIPKRAYNVLEANTPSVSIRTKCALVLVCHSWRKAAIQLLYRDIAIRSPRRANMILASLRSRCQLDTHESEYGQWTRHIEIYTHARGADNIHYLRTIFRILQCCPKLRTLSGTWIYKLPILFLNGLSQLYGPSLRGLQWNEQHKAHAPNSTFATPEFLGSFRSLHVLDISNFLGGDLTERTKTTLLIPVLPCVRDLVLSTHPQSLTTATFLALPALRHVSLKVSLDDSPISDHLVAAFLEAHGSAITSVDLPGPLPEYEPEPDSILQQPHRLAQHVDPSAFLKPHVCPNLTSLSFPCTSPILTPHVHPSLRRIGLAGVGTHNLHPNKSSHTKGHLMSFTPNTYPSLEVVRTIGFLVDAKTDPCLKDIFMWWVERFDKQGIDFQDGEGILWLYLDTTV